MDFELLSRFWKNGAEFQYIPVTVARMKAGGLSDKSAKKMYEEIETILMMNGYNKYTVNTYVHWKKAKSQLVHFIKNNGILRKLFQKYKGERIWVQ